MNMSKGQTLIEVLIALGVGIVILSSIVVVVILSLHNAQFARSQNLATSYSQEAMEVVRSIRNRSWTEFSALTEVDYCLGKNQTTLTPKPIGGTCAKIDNFFTREVKVEWIGTDCTDQKACVTITVSWIDTQGPHASKLVSYFTKDGAAGGGLQPNIDPKGWHDEANCSQTTGWTCDPNNYSEALAVHFYVDGPAGSGTLIGSTIANQTREAAVGQECGGNSNHGFTFPIPSSIKTGANRSIYVHAINTPLGNNPLLSGTPKIINCTN